MIKTKKAVVAKLVLASVLSIFALVGCQSGGSAKADLSNEKGKFSYAIGLEVGQSLKQFEEDFDVVSFFAGVEDMLNEVDAKLTDEEALQIKQSFFKAIQDKRLEKNKKEGEEFLKKNGERSEVTTTPSGLQFEVLEEGNGPIPDSSSKVTVHYRGMLLNGKEFDSSIKRGSPATFGVTGVVSGWTEALLMMKAGSKYKLYIPSELAYGERGAGGMIEPNSTLIFEVELLEVDGKKE